MHTIPPAFIPLKNSLENSSPFLLFLKLELSATTLYLVNDRQNQTWDGQTWSSFDFHISDLGESAVSETPSFSLTFANPERALQTYLEQYNGAVDSTATIYLLHASSLAGGANDILMTFTFKVGSVTANSRTISMNLTTDSPWRRRTPNNKCRRNSCRFKFQGADCAYTKTGYTLQVIQNADWDTAYSVVTGATSGATGTISAYSGAIISGGSIKSNLDDYAERIAFQLTGVSGTFLLGETVTQASSGSTGKILVVDGCDKTLASCRLYSNDRRFGGFPGIGRGLLAF